MIFHHVQGVGAIYFGTRSGSGRGRVGSERARATSGDNGPGQVPGRSRNLPRQGGVWDKTSLRRVALSIGDNKSERAAGCSPRDPKGLCESPRADGVFHDRGTRRLIPVHHL